MAIAAIIVVVAVFVIFDGCDPDVDPECGPPDPTGQVITYWYQHRSSREEVLQGMVQEFNDTNEWDITVQAVFAGSYGEIYNKIIEAITSGGELPAMSVAYQNQAATYVLLDGVVEVVPYIESRRWGFTDDELDDFFPFVAQGDYLPQFQGRYGFPPQRSMEVLYYNEDWLHELGYDHPPQTWEEFREMACAASDPAAGTYGYELSIDASTFADMVNNRGGQMLNEEASAYAFGDRAGLEVLTFIQGLFEDGCAKLEDGPYQDQIDFGNGIILFSFGSTSGLPDYRRAVDEGMGHNWSISTMPTTLDEPLVNIYGASLSIMHTTPEEQLASWLFIKWLTETEQSARWSRNTNYFPVRQSAAAELREYFAENPQFEKAFDFLKYDIAIEPGVAGYDECRDSIGAMMEKVVLGADAATWLEATVVRCGEFMPGDEDDE
jgi:multiple sugar transport system substrate-binding protein/sn-glycerol 3-phosphate transport system substrate-binding protein